MSSRCHCAADIIASRTAAGTKWTGEATPESILWAHALWLQTHPMAASSDKLEIEDSLPATDDQKTSERDRAGREQSRNHGMKPITAADPQ